MPKLGPQCGEGSKHSTGPAGLALHPSQFLGSAKHQGAQRDLGTQHGAGRSRPCLPCLHGLGWWGHKICQGCQEHRAGPGKLPGVRSMLSCLDWKLSTSPRSTRPLRGKE